MSFVAGVLIAMIASQRATTRAAQLQHDIARRGQLAHGVVTRIWRPPLAGSFPRIYFEFRPEGSAQALRCCHVDRRSAWGMSASLPAEGTTVAVRYLPENPARAVIARLVSRLGP